MRTSTTTKSKTTVYAKRSDSPLRARSEKKYDDMPANCRSVEDFAKALRKAVKEHYEKI